MTIYLTANYLQKFNVYESSFFKAISKNQIIQENSGEKQNTFCIDFLRTKLHIPIKNSAALQHNINVLDI